MTYWQVRAVYTGDMDRIRRWDAPGVICPVCQESHASFGSILPSVSLEGHPLEGSFRASQVHLKQWIPLRDALQPLLPEGQLARAGMSLGPLCGRVLRRFRVAWADSTSPVLSAEALDDLTARIPTGLRVVRSQLQSKRPYFELEALSLGALVTEESEEVCEACGRDPLDYPEDELVIRDVPDVPLFRLRNFPTILIANDEFANFLREELGPRSSFREARAI